MADDIRNCDDLDERLAPYVDGEDALAARGAIEQHLRGCPPCERAAREERLARTMVHEHRDALCARAPDALKARCQQSAASVSQPAPRSQPAPFALSPPVSTFLRRWAPLSLAATLVIAVAGVFLFGLNDRVEALAASLAIDHVKCFKVNGSATEADAQASERAWEADQGWPIVVPQTEASRQLKLVGVRRCISSDGRVAHMMYTWRGEPLSVYVLQAEAGHDAASHTMGAQEVIWRANHRTYAVVSSDASRDLTPILDYIKVHVQ